MSDWNDLHCAAGLDEVRRQLFAGINATDEEYLASVSGDEVVRKPKKSTKKPAHSPSKWNKPADIVDELNRRHAIVPVGGRVAVMNQEYDPGLERNLVTFSSRQDFKLRYENRFVYTGEKEVVDAGTFWLKSSDRGQYDGVVFSPGKDVDNYFNLFQGFGVEPSDSGSCDRFVDFVADVICDGDSDLFDYLWGWMAHLFQKPRELPGTGIILRGQQGVGKNTLVDAIGYLVGKAHYIQLNSLQQVTGRFSGHLVDVLLVFANEAIWGGDKSAEGTLKAMVTDLMAAIERKGQDIIAMRNYKRLIAASNEDWVIPRGMDDRRFVVLDVSPKQKENHAYFKAVRDELKHGGFEALMHRFMTADLSKFNPRYIPTKVRECGWELKIRSATSMVQWWFSVLDQGYLLVEGNSFAEDKRYVWPPTHPKPDLHRIYLKYCEMHRIMHPEMDCVMAKALKPFGLSTVRPRDHGSEYRPRLYKFPSIQQAREVFSEKCGIPMSYWDDDDD